MCRCHLMPYHLHNYLTRWERKNQKPNNGRKVYTISLIRKAFCLKQNAFLICLALNMRSHLCTYPPALAGGVNSC